MRYVTKFSILSGLAVLALAGCKQENNYPSSGVTTEATTTEVVPVPGPTTTLVVPVPGPTSTVTVSPSDTASPKP